jgi:hypothetical protein
MSLSLKKTLWSQWERARGPLNEDLKTIEVVLNDFIAFMTAGGTLNPFAIGGDPTPKTRYVANTGPGNSPKWDQVDLSNGVKSFLSLTHLGPASSVSVLVGRGSVPPTGAFEEIQLGAGLNMAGTVLSASGAVSAAGLALALYEGHDDDGGVLMPPGGGAGSVGPTGPTGPAGAAGATVFGMDGDQGESAFPIPGTPGATGATGAAGPAGSGSPGIDGMDGDISDWPLFPPTMTQPASIGITIDGAGAVITTGVKGFIYIPFNCMIVAATLMSTDASTLTGSIVIDVWKDIFANYPPTVADTITASALPTLSTAKSSQDTTLTGWNKTVRAGDVIGFNVNSVTTLQRVTLQLTVLR